MRSSFLFTSESVSEGHPDKVADQISDAIVDYFIGHDPESRVACETLVTTQRIVIRDNIMGALRIAGLRAVLGGRPGLVRPAGSGRKPIG